MKRDPDLKPAPKRGRYDRGLSRRERQSAQRERVVAAVIELVASERALNVANVVHLAGIGRNTFYEYFDDIEHALSAIQARAVREFSARVELVVPDVQAPLERVRAIARAWTEQVFESPALVRVGLRAQSEPLEPTQLSPLAQQVAKQLGAETEARSALPALNDPLRLLVVAATFDAVTRSHFGVQALAAEDLQRVLSELSLRLLR